MTDRERAERLILWRTGAKASGFSTFGEFLSTDPVRRAHYEREAKRLEKEFKRIRDTERRRISKAMLGSIRSLWMKALAGSKEPAAMTVGDEQ